ncbi:MAG: DUF1365 domain-containing protein [Chloroflexi bacterium]|nr:DUF1365 domain-containing protein [Chloroflexota bacterium]MDA1148300.1 DUF1365 domain-containing protein [Chloroflexota bacterium]
MVTPLDRGPLRSHLLAGTVRHRRARKTDYDFTHHAWYLALDLDEVDLVASQFRLLSHNRWNVLEYRDRDHLEGPPDDLAASVRGHLAERGIEAEDWRLTLIAYPRAFGYIFNPASFILCHDRTGVLRHVIAEVHNTHGERIAYDVIAERDSRVYSGFADKQLYVSPFIGSQARYHIRVLDEPGRLLISIHEYEDDELTLFARAVLERRPLSDRSLVGVLVRDPIVPLKTTALIFFHVARLWLRGLRWDRFRPRSEYRADRHRRVNQSERSGNGS